MGNVVKIIQTITNPEPEETNPPQITTNIQKPPQRTTTSQNPPQRRTTTNVQKPPQRTTTKDRINIDFPPLPKTTSDFPPLPKTTTTQKPPQRTTTNIQKPPLRIFAKKCGKCTQIISNPNDLIEALELDWHKTCFKCVICNMRLDEDTYRDMNEKLYCVDDYWGQMLTPREMKISNQLVAPVPERGMWIPRRLFPYEKSFGDYFCVECNRGWLSSHSFKKYRQRCKGCNENYYPEFMWLNHKKGVKKEYNEDNGKPHESALCEACKHGVCIRGGYERYHHYDEGDEYVYDDNY